MYVVINNLRTNSSLFKQASKQLQKLKVQLLINNNQNPADAYVPLQSIPSNYFSYLGLLTQLNFHMSINNVLQFTDGRIFFHDQVPASEINLKTVITNFTVSDAYRL